MVHRKNKHTLGGGGGGGAAGVVGSSPSVYLGDVSAGCHRDCDIPVVLAM